MSSGEHLEAWLAFALNGSLNWFDVIDKAKLVTFSGDLEIYTAYIRHYKLFTTKIYVQQNIKNKLQVKGREVTMAVVGESENLESLWSMAA